MSKRKIDFHIADRVGSREIISEFFISESGRTSYHYRCVECGTVGVIAQVNLKQSISCCNDWIHKGRDRLRVVWDDMHSRCYDPRHPGFSRYGGRGFTVSGWQDYSEFKAWALGQGYRYVDGLDLDRINNDLEYSPGNCRFIGRSENSRNRRDTRLITVNDITLPVSEWSERTGIQAQTILARVDRYGWSPEDAVKRDAERSRIR